MKKMFLLTALAFAATAGSSFAQYAGQFGYGIELTGAGTGATSSGTTELYALDNSGTTRLLPLSPAQNTSGTYSSATLNSTSWTGASTASNPTFNLGTFTVGGTLTLDGGSYLTYKGDNADVTGATLFYRISSGSTGSGSYTGSVVLNFNQDSIPSGDSGGSDDQRWATENANINLIAGLGAGTYTLSTYGETFQSTGNVYENNGGNGDYSATFTVVNPTVTVPEPGTWAMMITGLGFLVAYQVRRRQSFN